MKIKFNFKNPEDFHRAERLAYDGSLDCSDFLPPEYKYFTELRKIYHAFKFEGMTPLEGEYRKKSLLIDYRKYLANFEYSVQTYKSYQENIKVSEMLKTRIQKSDDVHDIAVAAVKAIGLMTHDEAFIKTNSEKLEALK